MKSPQNSLIELAQEPDFRLGHMQVRPSLREVGHSEGSDTLEPRVMQVLVALVQANGATVSRDVLIARCWGEVVVGDDAVQRCIGRLRKLADAVGGFRIETLSRVGYRLEASVSANTHSNLTRETSNRLLAVLPFDNVSGDVELGYVADGVADEILQAISRRSSIRTIGRTSSFQFRGNNKKVNVIGEALGATHVLDGSVRQAGGKIRVAAYLMDLADHTMIWSDRFDGTLDELFELQEQVALATVAALAGVFVQPSTGAKRSVELHDLMLQLRSWMGPQASEGLVNTRSRVERLQSLAGHDAAAWGLAASVFAALTAVVQPDQRATFRSKARAAAERALLLDSTCGEAHKALFLIEPCVGRFLEVERRLIAARANAPDDGEIHWSLYVHYLCVGRLRESFAEAERAYRVDPLRPANVLAYANALFTSGEEQQALGLMRHAIDRWPDDPVVFSIVIWTAASAREFAFVEEVVRKAPSERFTGDSKLLIRSALLAVAGIRSPSTEVRDRALTVLQEDISRGTPRFSLIGLCAYLGIDLDVLYDHTDRANFEPLLRGDVSLPAHDGLSHLFLRVNERLRQSPRFLQLCKRLGLVDYWLTSETRPDCLGELPFLDEFKPLLKIGRRG